MLGDGCEGKHGLRVLTKKSQILPVLSQTMQNTPQKLLHTTTTHHESETPLSPVAQEEGIESNPELPELEASIDEPVVDVPLPVEPNEMSDLSPQGWVTEEAFFTARLAHDKCRNAKRSK